MNKTASSNTQQLAYWLALQHMVGMGPATISRVYKHCSHLENVFKNPALVSAELGFGADLQRQLENPPWEKVDHDLRWLEQPEHHILTLEDPRYPELLAEIPAPPPILFVKGDPSVLKTSQIAMVGSRNSSPQGNQTAEQFAAYLSQAGLTITSGLALGIDAMSHRGALTRRGKTIAVLGTGLDTIYPKQHQELAEQIVMAQGALVSEFSLGTPPKPEHFPRRNRIISGLSLAVLVVEAALKSGSLITARFALEQGREVLAIPGSIHHPLARGCNDLIRQGAKLVETVEDVLEELRPQLEDHILLTSGGLHVTMPKEGTMLGPEYEKLLESMGFEPVSIDSLVTRNGMTVDIIASMLLILELNGVIKSVSGGYIRMQ